MKPKLVVVLGPTAVGKTKFAVNLAAKFNGEIISADSRQVYKFMDIGTGKDLNEYCIEDKKIPYHLINIISPDEEYDLFKYQNDFSHAFNKITETNRLPILVGGTGLYLNSVLQNYNLPEVNFDEQMKLYENYSFDELLDLLKSKKNRLHNTTDITDRKRSIRAIIIASANHDNKTSGLMFDTLVLGIQADVSKIKKNIAARLKYRLENGMIDEAKNLLNMGISFEKLKYFGLEYKFLAEYLQGNLNYNDMHQKLRSAIFNFAKRQMTWFRKMEKQGIKINWIDPNQFDFACQLVHEFIENKNEQ
jgi:tRNA dimethylallyltransferase